MTPGRPAPGSLNTRVAGVWQLCISTPDPPGISRINGSWFITRVRNVLLDRYFRITHDTVEIVASTYFMDSTHGLEIR